MRVFDYILDLIYPQKCVFCGKIIKGSDLCQECEKELPYTKGDSVSQKFGYVASCLSPLYYDGKVRDSILRYKFRGAQSYAGRYGQILAQCVENNLDCGSIHVISWVPLSRKRKRQRGYNQAELIAMELAPRVGLKAVPCLEKLRNNPTQSGTASAAERAKNVSGVYRALAPDYIEGKTILLVDDVVTTGSTLSECALTLRRAGAEKVYCAALARHKD